MHENIEQYRRRLASAPSHIQEIMTAVETGKIIGGIGKKYQLPDEKIQDIAYQTGLILLKMENFTSLYMKLKEKLAVSEDVAIAIASDINKQILYKVKNKPSQVQNKNQPQREGAELVQGTRDGNEIPRIKISLAQNNTERIADILDDIE